MARTATKKEKPLGIVTHYFGNIGVAVIKLSQPLAAGDSVFIKGATTDFSQKVTSMQIEHEAVQKAKKGQSIGLKVNARVREGDAVFKVPEK